MSTLKWLSIFAFAGFSLSAIAQTNSRPGEDRTDGQIQTNVNGELQKKAKFGGVTAQVEDGIVTLSGTVALYIDKVDGEKRVRRVKNVDGVRNHIEVEENDIGDEELQKTLANKLRYDRIGYGIVFNALTVGVSHGTVTIGGKVRDYPDRDSAIAIVETTVGVKDVVDEIDVAPISGFDDELRVRLARAIYGHPSLQRYAIDPQAPIRIAVENGNVELSGVVLTDQDRQIAYARAQSTPGVFRVKNNLIVAPKGAN